VPLTLLVTSPRVAPGLMSWPAWQAVADADRVLASVEHPGVGAVRAAGHPVEVMPDAAVADLTGADATVVWLASDEEAERLPGELAALIVDRPEAGDVEVLHASYDVPGARLLDLVTVMDELRRNCPWDREQTHRSLARYLLEETYELLEAIENDDYVHLREELGDLLLQVYFHSRIASEGTADSAFDIDDVAGDIIDKLVHRHPHVFAGLDVSDVDEVETNWETLKASEKGRVSVLEGVPMAMPALALADKVLGKAAKVGITMVGEGAERVETTPGTIGDRLLALVAEARAAGLDPEQELRDAVRRVVTAVRAAESS
jgi:XTP/dITP diphosphohydrolase